MRGIRYLAAATAAAGLLAGGAASASAATAHPAASVHLKGGRTSVTTGPGIALTLLKNGIVPIATAPGSQSLVWRKSGPAARFSFPVTGGRVSLSPPSGDIRHRGGILFFNATNGKHVRVSRFTIDLKHSDLTGIVNGNAMARVTLFRLSLAHAKVNAGKHMVTVRGIGVKLSAVAAKALNAALGTTLFAPGLALGTASTTLRF
ncbi:MAG: hypothetical protein ACR2FU_20660 [Streptosporangiaceae bacterium]